jgi:hypothetical protein
MMNKRAFITAHKAQYAVSTFCRLLEISRGWFYGFLAIRNFEKAGRCVREWVAARNQFTIRYPERFNK